MIQIAHTHHWWQLQIRIFITMSDFFEVQGNIYNRDAIVSVNASSGAKLRVTFLGQSAQVVFNYDSNEERDAAIEEFKRALVGHKMLTVVPGEGEDDIADLKTQIKRLSDENTILWRYVPINTFGEIGRELRAKGLPGV